MYGISHWLSWLVCGLIVSVLGSNLVTEEFLMAELPFEEDGEIFDDMDMWVRYPVRMMFICLDFGISVGV